MCKFRFDYLTHGGWVIAALMAGLFAMAAWYSSTKLEQAASQVAHSRKVLSAASQISLNLASAEMAYRNYEVYGTRDYLLKRNESILKLAQSIEEAEGIVHVSGNEDLSSHVDGQGGSSLSNAVFKFNGRYDGAATSNYEDIIPIVARAAQTYERILEEESDGSRESAKEALFQRNVGYASLALFVLFMVLSVVFFRQRLHDGNPRMKEERANGDWLRPEFIAHVSHELRTTLNAIIGLSEMLKDGLLGRMDDTQAGHINTIYDCAQHLRGLVNNILDLSKIDAGKMRLELVPGNISELCECSIATIRGDAAARHIHLHLNVASCADNNLFYLDAIKVRQMLLNLLSNAVKFTQDKGCVELCVRLVPHSEVGRMSGNWASLYFPLVNEEYAEFIEFNVLDNGAGVSSEAMAGLFQPYCQAPSRLAHGRDGTGLGLVLVKRMAELHGGTVAMESAEGQGSRFVVWLPARMQGESVAGILIPEQPQNPAVSRAYQYGKEVVQDLARQRTFLNA